MLSPSLLLPVLGVLVGGAAAPLLDRLGAEHPGRRWPRTLLAIALSTSVGVYAGAASASPLAAWLTALLGWQLVLIALVDGEHFWLPDWLTWPLAATGIAAAWAGGPTPLPDTLIGAAVGFGSLWLLGEVYRRVRGRQGLGGGDPFLLGALGAWVGWMGLPSVLLLAALAGLAVVLAKVLLRRPVSGEDRLPFGVFLAIGGWLTWLYGPLGL